MIVASGGTAARPARTDSLRVAPPATPSSRSASAAGTTTTTPADAASAVSTGVIDHPPVAEQLVLLGSTEAFTGAAGHDDRPHELGT